MPKTSLAVTPRPRYMEVAEGGRQGEEAAKINMRGRRREVLGISGAGWYRKGRETREQETMHRRLFLHPFVRLLGVYSIPIAISNCQLPSSSFPDHPGSSQIMANIVNSAGLRLHGRGRLQRGCDCPWTVSTSLLRLRER